jgi:biopolymer transport protein ExbD
MIAERRESWSRQIRRHRNVYRFGGVWARTLLAAVPWLNAAVLAVLLLAVHGQLAVAPGVVFDLPRAPLREGVRQGLTALMIEVARDAPGGEETLIFFDDDRYSAQDGEQMVMLSERLKNRMALGRSRELLLLADKRVPHGDVIRFVNVAREAGVLRVNVAEKPE